MIPEDHTVCWDEPSDDRSSTPPPPVGHPPWVSQCQAAEIRNDSAMNPSPSSAAAAAAPPLSGSSMPPPPATISSPARSIKIGDPVVVVWGGELLHGSTVHALSDDGPWVTVYWEHEDPPSITHLPAHDVFYDHVANGGWEENPNELPPAAPAAEQAPVSTNHEHQPLHPRRAAYIEPSGDFDTFADSVIAGVKARLQQLKETQSQNSETFHAEFMLSK